MQRAEKSLKKGGRTQEEVIEEMHEDLEDQDFYHNQEEMKASHPRELDLISRHSSEKHIDDEVLSVGLGGGQRRQNNNRIIGRGATNKALPTV